MHRILSDRAGPETARLFAEPLISRGNDQAAPTVSWYSDHPGHGVPMHRLDEAARSQIEAALRDRLAPLDALIDDAEAGPLISAALYILADEDIWSVDGVPVLINWGMLPDGAGTGATARLAHYRATLGRFLPLDVAPPLDDRERARFTEDNTRRTATAAAATAAAAGAGATVAMATPAAASGTASGTSSDAAEAGAAPPTDGPAQGEMSSPPIEERGPVPLVAWLPLVLLLLLAGGILAWLLIPGNRIFADDVAPPAAIPDEAAIAAARDANRALEYRLADLRAAHSGAVCRADGTLVLPGGVTVDGLLPPDPEAGDREAGRVAPGIPDPLVPPDAQRVVVGGAGAEVADSASLLAHIDSRTAMVLAVGEGLSTGTGFFVGPDLLVTNFHVIGGAAPDQIFVTSKTMGGLRRAELLKSLGPMEEVGADFALLRVQGANQPAYDIRRNSASLRLQAVIAAGYPGDVLGLDREFEALRGGDITAVPALTVTNGTVNAEQTLSERTRTVVHSAPMSTGNSGGPLIDMCGRVVGVNTFVMRGPMRNLNFALAAPDLLAFLSGTPAQPALSEGPCQPRVARPAPPPPGQSQ
ncbi:MAG: trypsin-like peptidase domain-containing protein [Roseovarius sp.]|nr:trypsin-like peptidase domain-containing protein [Roseovarius sp.]